MAWKTSIYQKPVGIAGRQHNFIVVEDDKGNPYAEYNGGPVDGNGRFIPLDPSDLASINSRLSGGILGVDVRLFPFDRPLNMKEPDTRLLQEMPMTREQALAAMKAAQACSKEINDLRLPYRLTGTGPEIDRNSESNAPLGPRGFNSNGVFSTLLACMGVNPDPPGDREPARQRPAHSVAIANSRHTAAVSARAAGRADSAAASSAANSRR